jgi:O-antigen/teichoic acid export membrane protein
LILLIAALAIFGILWFIDIKNLPHLTGDSVQKLPEGTLSLTIAIGAILSMIIGVWLVFGRLKEKNQGFGPNSLKALGIVLFIPALLLIAIQKNFSGETLAALFGTIAGYVLSHSKDDDKNG